jgi:hypothetical protein
MGDIPLRGEETLADFARILAKEFEDTEEVRYDTPNAAGLINGSAYAGIAPDGSATSAAVWTVVRTYYDPNSNPSRQRIKKGIAWDNRAVAANWP